jgi:integrase
MVSLPIYKRGNVYTLHTRINGRQVKLSLRTHDKWTAITRALEVLNAMKFDKDPPLPPGFEHLARGPVKRYEVDAQRGIFKADGPEDHARMMEALKLAKDLQQPAPSAPAPVVIVQDSKPKGGRFTVLAMFSDYANKKQLKESSKREFEISAKQFNKHVNSRQLYQLTHTDIDTFIAKLTGEGNSKSTIDKKVGNLRTMINFVKKQRTFEGENITAEKNLLSKAERNNRGQKAQAVNDLVDIFNREEYRSLKDTSPSYYYINILAMITGMRISSVARLTAAEFKTTLDGIRYIDIDDDKTPTGRRDVCLPIDFHTEVKSFLTENNGFGLVERKEAGKGFSDPVRKMQNEYFELIGYGGRRFTAHAYRKTFNDYMIEEGVPLEIRCQLLGHAINHVNVEVYGKKKIPMKEVAKKVVPLQQRLLNHLGLT